MVSTLVLILAIVFVPSFRITSLAVFANDFIWSNFVWISLILLEGFNEVVVDAGGALTFAALAVILASIFPVSLHTCLLLL